MSLKHGKSPLNIVVKFPKNSEFIIPFIFQTICSCISSKTASPARGRNLMSYLCKMRGFLVLKKYLTWVKIHETRTGQYKLFQDWLHLNLVSYNSETGISVGEKVQCSICQVLKAFDSVNRQKLWSCLKSAGFIGKVLRILMSVYSVFSVCEDPG